MEKAGEITKLERQKKFILIPSQRGDDGKVIERECAYRADFVYRQGDRVVVEDTKGKRTKEYILKRKMMLCRHGVRIKET